MKMNSRLLTSMPNARYIVTNRGVKAIGTDVLSGACVQLNISKRRAFYTILDIVWAKGLGEQYV